MKSNSSSKLILGLILSTLIFATACKSGPVAIKTGDKVVALWSGTSWYEGTADTPCDKGFNVKWADGTPASCIAADKIVFNKEVKKDVAKVGTAVFAKWVGVAFFEAKISAVNGDKYSVEYSDGSKKDDLGLADLRLK